MPSNPETKDIIIPPYSPWWHFDEPKVTAFDTSHGPALAEYHGKLYMAWKGKSDENIYYSAGTTSSLGVLKWSNQIQVPDTKTSNGPALIVFGGRLCMVWKAAGSDQTIWYSEVDPFYVTLPGKIQQENYLHWNKPKQISGMMSSYRPALAVYGDKLFMAWKGKGNEHQLWFRTATAKTMNNFPLIRKLDWTEQSRVFPTDSGMGSTHGPALAVVDNKLIMVWKGKITGQTDDPKIWFSKYDGKNPDKPWLTTDIDKNQVLQIETYGYRYANKNSGAKSSSHAPALAFYDTDGLAKQKGKGHSDVHGLIMIGKKSGNNKLWLSEFTGELDKAVSCSGWCEVGSGDLGTEEIRAEDIACCSSDTPAAFYLKHKMYIAYKGSANDTRIWFTRMEIKTAFSPL